MKASGRKKSQGSSNNDEVEAAVAPIQPRHDEDNEPMKTDSTDADMDLDDLDDDAEEADLDLNADDLVDDDGLEDEDEELPRENGMSRTWWEESSGSEPALW